MAMQVFDSQALDPTADLLLEQTKELYCSQSVSTTARAWNELREKVLVDALDNVFKPQFERELRSKLISDARESACLKCSHHIWQLAVEGPVAVGTVPKTSRLALALRCTWFCMCHCNLNVDMASKSCIHTRYVASSLL